MTPDNFSQAVELAIASLPAREKQFTLAHLQSVTPLPESAPMLAIAYQVERRAAIRPSCLTNPRQGGLILLHEAIHCWQYARGDRNNDGWQIIRRERQALAWQAICALRLCMWGDAWQLARMWMQGKAGITLSTPQKPV